MRRVARLPECDLTGNCWKRAKYRGWQNIVRNNILKIDHGEAQIDCICHSTNANNLYSALRKMTCESARRQEKEAQFVVKPYFVIMKYFWAHIDQLNYPF